MRSAPEGVCLLRPRGRLFAALLAVPSIGPVAGVDAETIRGPK